MPNQKSCIWHCVLSFFSFFSCNLSHFQGETKGKESSLEELLTLNPSLQAPKPTPPPQPPQKTLQASTAVNRQNGIHAQSMILDDEDTFLLDHINMIPAKGLLESSGLI